MLNPRVKSIFLTVKVDYFNFGLQDKLGKFLCIIHPLLLKLDEIPTVWV